MDGHGEAEPQKTKTLSPEDSGSLSEESGNCDKQLIKRKKKKKRSRVDTVTSTVKRRQEHKRY